MSLIGTVANYGGRQPDNVQNIKQFVTGAGSFATWIFKKLTPSFTVQTPTDKLKPVYIDNDLYVTGSIYNPSDFAFKENINPLISVSNVDDILKLQPVSYTYKTNPSQTHYGFIAQDIEQIYPNLVLNIDNRSDPTSIPSKVVNYTELIPLIILKLQSLDKEIHNHSE